MIRRLWRSNPVLSLAFILALAACLFFTGRAALFATNLYFRSEKPVAGWMTPRYIALAYGLEDDDLTALLGNPTPEDQRKPLYRIAQRNDVPLVEMISDVQALVDAKDGGL
ncbi:MAG: hypothetical protein C0427_16030 [Rhodobacter sp.]|nr:hypothetical protein [Rhodobacter sp.]